MRPLLAPSLVSVIAIALGVGPGCAKPRGAGSGRDGGADGQAGNGGAGGAGMGGGGGGGGTGGSGAMCKVGSSGDSIGKCDKKAPPDSFSPEVQWTWDLPGAEGDVIVIPLVANLTDDNGDGHIDLCDVPDVVVTAGLAGPTHIYILDGKTGTLELKIDTPVNMFYTPALGDIDGDGLPDIVTADPAGKLIAFAHDGTLEWLGDDGPPSQNGHAIALGDLDADGTVEIVVNSTVYDHFGKVKWSKPGKDNDLSATTLADLDGDGNLEVVVARPSSYRAAYHFDGSLYFEGGVADQATFGAFPQVANLDADPEPEILLTYTGKSLVLEHDGTVKMELPSPATKIAFPATVHDFDGDGAPNFALSTGTDFSVRRQDGSLLWSDPIGDGSGIAGCTAFDFLGSGAAQAMYADEKSLFVWDGSKGGELMKVPRSSATLIEYPVVADIDNDGSAEILVVSNRIGGGARTAPSVQAIRDKDDRWIQARRIWNQHTYHVTNVREDGTIPKVEAPNWKTLNTFRTQAQIESGKTCRPCTATAGCD